MKKRVKLLTTIASLCLAVALMAFGVYAATNVNFTVTSTINFTSTEISGYWTIVVDGTTYGGAEKLNQNVEAAPELSVQGTEKTFAYSAAFTNTSTSTAYIKVIVGDFTGSEKDCMSISVALAADEKLTDSGTEGVYALAKGETGTVTFTVKFDPTNLEDKTQDLELAQFIFKGTATNTASSAAALV